MKQAFNTYQMASWLLGEALDPNDPMNEDDDLDLEDTESDKKDEEEDEEESDDADNAEDAEDADADLDDLDLDDGGEDAAEGEEDAENLNNNELLSRIDQKLDQLIDKQPDADEEFDLDISNPVCPCCGARLNIIDNTADTEDLATGEEGEDFDIDALLDGEGPEGEEEEDAGEEGDETYGEPIEAMDDDLDITPDNGEDGYVSLEDEDEEEDEEN